MKKFYLLCALFITTFAKAQTYENSWINTSQEYYKIKISQDGIYRLTAQNMAWAGIAYSTWSASKIQLWYKGQQQYIYVYDANQNDVLDAATDYIEFYGEHNTGWFDKQLYADSTWQPNPNYSLVTDTSVYFLSYSPVNPGLRFDSVDFVQPTFPAAPYFFKDSYLEESMWYNVGYPDQDVDYVKAEGHVGTLLITGEVTSTQKGVNTQNAYLGGPNAEVRTTTAWSNNNPQAYSISGPGISYTDSSGSGYEVRNHFFSVSPSQLSATTTTLTYSILPGAYTRRMSFVNLSIRYAHTPDMENASSFKMYVLDDIANGKTFLDLTNFSNSTSATVLYDVTNHRRIDVSQNGSGVQAVVPNDGNSTPKFCMLASSSGVNVVPIGAISRLNYVNASGQSRFNNMQGLGADSAYIIVTHASLLNVIKLGNGYQDYRNETTGNQNRVVVIDAAELYDQFAYGIANHGMAIRNFVHYAIDKWGPHRPQALFLVGKSIKPAEMRHSAGLWGACLVTTFGYPASDLAMAYGVNGSLFDPAIPVGRLSANNATDVANYLDKVKEYEAKQHAPVAEPWMKNVLHFGGGSNPAEQGAFRDYLNYLKDVIEDTVYGGKVTSFFKNSPDPVEFGLTAQIKNKIDSGVSMMMFFGHASGSTFDISTDLAQNYTNYGKYPIMMASSCYAGDFHTSDPSNSEQFVLEPGKAAIAFLASVGQGDAYYLYVYDTALYKNIAYRNYGQSIGKIMQHTIQVLQTDYNGNSGIKRVVNEMSLQGDPNLIYNSWSKPDLVAEESNISFTPDVITSDMDTFSLHFKTRNYARAVADSFRVTVTRSMPNGIDSVYTVTRPRCFFEDDFSINMKVSGLNAAGLNNFTVKVDLNPDTIPEMQDLSNNIATTSLFIYSNDIIPIYPAKYAIHPYSTVTLKASTSNPLGATRNYKFEIDTSYFNDDPQTHSPMYRFNFVQSSGGVVSWSPANYTLLPNTVYYWRVYDDTTTINKNESSFIYIPNKTGWSQAHFFQFNRDGYENTEQDSAERTYEFVQNIKTLVVTDYGWPGPPNEYLSSGYTLNGEVIEYNFCAPPAIHLAIIDSLTLLPVNTCNNNRGQMNLFIDPDGDCNKDGLSSWTGCHDRPDNYFIYQCGADTQLQAMQTFINSVPNGNHIILYSAFPFAYSTCDPAFFNSLTALGFNPGLVQDNLPFIFYVQKGVPGTDTAVFGSQSNSLITLERELETKWYRGSISSEVIGPATHWTDLHWGEHTLENGATEDSASVSIFGLNQLTSNWDTLVTGIQPNTPVYSLSAINASLYPYLKLNVYLEDLPLRTPPQMDRWQIYYDEAPECALNASRHYSFYHNPISEGDTIKLSIAVDNIGNLPMDSLSMSFFMYDRDRTRHDIKNYKMDSLRVGQSLNASVAIDSTFGLYGENSLWVEANPFGSSHQLEQQHFNNIAEVKFNVNRDVINPILDVTFDAIHILDGDIVSGKPHIVVQLHDENKFLALDDTADFRVYLKSPSQNSKVQLNFSDLFYNSHLEFTPAQLPKNSAKIEFDPIFAEDGIYSLEVEAADKSKNESGSFNYRITFEVINKSTITEVLNYPNPFSTSTRFVFVLTGNEVPDHMKIRIMTVSGKVVREILRNELGNIHVGRNITDYAWDGRDEFGDRLANGVYLYKVYTEFSNGDDIEHRGTDADQFFKKGWGKMYLMR